MPLIYNSLESEHAEVQEKALQVIPGVLDILDVSSIQEIVFVKVAVRTRPVWALRTHSNPSTSVYRQILFTKTRLLSTKIGTLHVFRDLVKVLDKTSLTQKLVPLLAKIKTKEAEVMMATLCERTLHSPGSRSPLADCLSHLAAVHEAMGAKVDREAVANLVLPQLWSFSMGPLLSSEQVRLALSSCFRRRPEADGVHQFLPVCSFHDDNQGFGCARGGGARATPAREATPSDSNQQLRFPIDFQKRSRPSKHRG